jgi:hypothetical protein
MRRKAETHSTNTRKKRLKSSFRYSTMKPLENAREYKRLKKNVSTDRRKGTQAARQSKRLLKMS